MKTKLFVVMMTALFMGQFAHAAESRVNYHDPAMNDRRAPTGECPLLKSPAGLFVNEPIKVVGTGVRTEKPALNSSHESHQ